MQALPALDARKYRERAVHSRLVLAHETALEHHLVRLITSLGHHAARMYRDHGNEGLGQAVQQMPDRLRHLLRPSLTATAREFADRLAQSGKAALGYETKAFETLDGAIRDWADAHVGRRIRQIDQSMRSAIQEVIRRGLDEGWGEAEIAAAIEEATAGEVAGARARRIARTETHTAANVGQFIAAQSSPLDYEKEWLATEDVRTREDHANANGQRVPLYMSFVIGGDGPSQGGRFTRNRDGSWVPDIHPGGDTRNRPLTFGDLSAGMVEMLFPGDTTAPAAQVVNCRCACLYVPTLIGPEPQPMEEGLPEMSDQELLERALPPRPPRRRRPRL